MAANVAVTYNFTAGTPAVADNVDQNFTDLVNWVNTNAVHLDGSKAFTAVPSGPATDPTSSNQLTRKAYVDAGHRGTMGYASTTTAQTGISSTPTDLTSLSVTFTAVTGRRYKISASVRVIQNVGAANNTLSITDGSNVEVGKSLLSVPGGSNGFHTPIAVVTPTSGSVTYKLRLSTSADNTQTSPAATAPAFILVEDIGV